MWPQSLLFVCVPGKRSRCLIRRESPWPCLKVYPTVNEQRLVREKKIMLEMTRTGERGAWSTHGAGSAVWRSQSVILAGWGAGERREMGRSGLALVQTPLGSEHITHVLFPWLLASPSAHSSTLQHEGSHLTLLASSPPLWSSCP